MLENQEGETLDLSCEECLSILDYYIDCITAGGDWRRFQHSMANHFSRCFGCHQELLRRLKEWERLSEDQDAGDSDHE
jgi:hypothetical protein